LPTFVEFERYERFEVFTAVNIQIEAIWVVTPCRIMVGYQLSEVPEDEGSMDIRNVAVLPQYYTASQHMRPRL